MALASSLRRLGVLALVGLLVLGACTGDEGPSPGSPADDAGDAAPADDPPPTPELDPPRERALDLSWREECAWIGDDPDATGAEPPELVDLEIELLPDDLEELYARSPRSDDRLPGAYRIDGRGPLLELRDPGLRFRGNSARGLPKKSFNVRFQEDVRGLGSDRVNLNAMYTDPSFVREHLAFRMFSATGVPAPRTAYVDLDLNGVYEGLYLYVQRVDARLLEEHGLPAAGVSLVRDRTREALGENRSLFSRLDLPVDDREALAGELQDLMDARDAPDWGSVADLVAWVYDGDPTEQDAAGVHARIDVDNLVDWYALHVLTGDVDAFSDDYWLYDAGDGSGWRFIPWDKDLAFGAHYVRDHGGVLNHLFHYEWDVYERATSRNDLLARTLAPAEIREGLEQRLAELMTDYFTLGYVCDELAAVATVIADSAAREQGDDAFEQHGSNHFGATGDHDLHLSRILDYIQLRYAFIDRQIDPVEATEAAAGTATVAISVDDVGTSLLFTDAEGWTVARLDVLEVIEPGSLTVSVAASDRSADIDREWTVDGDAVVRGQLNLYYRNTVAFEDWYLGSDDDDVTEPVGGQRDLHVVEVVGGDHVTHRSVANPYSNRVAAELTIDGPTTYVLETDVIP